MTRNLLLFLLLFGIHTSALATHIVGGELTYECIGGDRYVVSLTVFRDCDTGVPWFDDPASIGVFNSAGVLVGDLRLRPIGNDTLDLDLTDSCYVAPPNVCIHRSSYRDTVTLPFLVGGYQLAYQRCCRNQDIVNIVDPLGTGATYTALLTEAAMLGCNSTPVFRDWPPVYLCVDVPIVFDHSAVDADGDSLVYEMCAPFEGATPFNPMPQPPFSPAYDSVVWANGFSTANMLGGTDVLQINPQTGLLTGTPTQFGVFVVGIRVREYRNGVLISTVQRDFQYAIGQCGRRNNAAFFTPEIICDDALMVVFQNNSQTNIQQYQWDFGDLSTTLDQSSLASPAYIYPDSGRYLVRLIVAPNTVCADTTFRLVNVQYESLLAGFTYAVPSCSDTALVQFANLSRDSLVSIVAWDWSFGDGGTDTAQVPTHTYQQGGTYPIRLIATAANGCKDTLTDNFTIALPSLNLADSTWICPSATGVLLNAGGDPTLSYNWSPSSFLSANNVASPFASPPAANTPMLYNVTATANNTNGPACRMIGQTIVDRSPAFTTNIQGLTTTCLPDVTLTANSSTNASFVWSLSPTGTPVLGTTNPLVLPMAAPDTTTVYLLATNAQGCTLLDSHTVIRQNFNIIPDFTYNFLNCGGPTFIQFTDLTSDFSQGAITNWDWTASLNGQVTATSNQQNPTLSFGQSGTYLVRLTIQTANGCTGTRQVFINIIVPSITSPDSVGICSGQSNIVLNPNGNSNFTYQWSPATNLSSTSAVSPTTNTSVSRTYYVTVTYFNNGTICQGVDSVRVVIPPPLTVDVPNTNYYCGTSVQLTATPSRPVVQYQWSGDPSFFTILATGNPVTVTPTVFPTSGYYVRATDAYGCTATDFAMVQRLVGNISPQMSYSVVECGDTLRIQFNDITTDTVGARIISRTWTVSNGQTSNLANPIFSFTRTQFYTIRLDVVLANGCTGSLTQTLNFNVPTLNGPTGAGVCTGAASAVLNPGGSPNLAYRWSPSTGLNSSTAASPIATPPSLPFVYQVTVTANNGGVTCSEVYAVSVNQAPLVSLNLPPDSTVCTEPFVLVAETQNSVLLEWSLNNAFSPVAVYNSNPVYIGFGYVAGTTPIYARVRDQYGCIAVDSIYITRVVDTVPVRFSYDYLGCATPMQVRYNDDTQHGFPIQRWDWDFGDGRVDYTQNPTIPYTYNGQYPVSLTITDNRGCVGTLTDSIEINIPALTSPDSIALCGGGILELNSGGNPNLQYNWSPNINISSTTATSPSVTVSQDISYVVTITAINGNDTCVEVKTVAIGVGNVVLNVSADTTICSNTINLQASSPTAQTYYWAIDNQFNFLIGVGSPFLTNINRSRLFYVAAIDAYGCVAMDSVQVNISQTPMQPNFDISTLFCAGGTGLQFTDRTDSLDQQPNTWVWSFGDGDSSFVQHPMHTYSQSGSYDVTLYVSAANGCNASTTRPVQVQVISPVAAADTFRLCLGEPININPSGQAQDRYIWSNQNAGLNNYNVAQPVATPNSATTYRAEILSINSVNGQSDTCRQLISRTVLPQTFSLSLADQTYTCPAELIGSISATSNAAQYQWLPDSLIISGQGSNSVEFDLLGDSLQIWLVAADSLGCQDTASAWINIEWPVPSLQISASQDTINPGDSLQLVATQNLDYSYIWSPSANLSNPTIYNPIARPVDNPTVFIVTVTDGNGCRAADTLAIYIQSPLCGEPNIFVPNVFTPDGDGLNDLLFVRGNNLTDVEFYIYDRWGELVFQSNNQNEGWDGTFKGKQLPPDVYGYYMRCRCQDGTPYFKKGNVTIIR